MSIGHGNIWSLEIITKEWGKACVEYLNSYSAEERKMDTAILNAYGIKIVQGNQGQVDI